LRTVENAIIGDSVLDYTNGSVSKPIIRTQWYNDVSSTWVDFDSADVQTRTISFATENDRYQIYSFLPPSSNLGLVLNNYDQIYSTGAQTEKSAILKKNLKVRWKCKTI
jgi:hypothetical protein